MTRHRLVLTASVALLGCTLAGCVERKMIIRSSPSGARVLLDDVALDSPTPVEVPFDWGGTRRVTLIAPGHAVLEAEAALSDPWYTWFPVDVFSELLYPGTLKDVQEFSFELRPYDPNFPADDAASDALRARQERLMARAQAYRAGGSDGPAAGTVNEIVVRKSGSPPAAPAADGAPLPPPVEVVPPPPPRGRDSVPPPPPPRRR